MVIMLGKAVLGMFNTIITPTSKLTDLAAVWTTSVMTVLSGSCVFYKNVLWKLFYVKVSGKSATTFTRTDFMCKETARFNVLRSTMFDLIQCVPFF
jgi:hypothetical protein